jgi:hypothetical protein
VKEESWICYPYFKTVFTNKWMKENFNMTVESFHVQGPPLPLGANV